MTQRVTVSTGHTFRLPVELSATIVGAVFAADRDDVASLLPRGLDPIRATATRAAMTVLAVRYDRVGEGTIEPYDEVGVVLPAVETGTRTWPYGSVLRRAVSGYVQTLPVSSEPARAFGADIWGYPKFVAEIDLRDRDSQRRATVRADGQRVLTFRAQRPPTVPARLSGYNFTVRDGRVLCERTRLSGRVGAWPRPRGVHLSFGDHPVGRRLADVAVADRPLCTVAADGEFEIGPGFAVGPE